MHRLLPCLLLAACPDPGEIDQRVDFRDGLDGGAVSGERGTIRIAEVMWSGSVTDEGVWDPTDVFVELRNEGNRAVNLSGWHLALDGAKEVMWRIPATDFQLQVGEQAIVAAKSTGCFPEPEWVLPELSFPQGEPFRLTLMDADERLMEPAGSTEMPPFAGGYDFVSSYSMERITLMFGGQGGEPQSWHFYNRAPCPNAVTQGEGNGNLSCFEAIPNNDRVAERCRRHTRASPSRPNSPDYSGAYASGGFD